MAEVVIVAGFPVGVRAGHIVQEIGKVIVLEVDGGAGDAGVLDVIVLPRDLEHAGVILAGAGVGSVVAGVPCDDIERAFAGDLAEIAVINNGGGAAGFRVVLGEIRGRRAGLAHNDEPVEAARRGDGVGRVVVPGGGVVRLRILRVEHDADGRNGNDKGDVEAAGVGHGGDDHLRIAEGGLRRGVGEAIGERAGRRIELAA